VNGDAVLLHPLMLEKLSECHILRQSTPWQIFQLDNCSDLEMWVDNVQAAERGAGKALCWAADFAKTY
jgi:hypothetical protein